MIGPAGAAAMVRHRAVLGIVAMCAALAGCGYHVSGRADLMPKTIHTIAIPAFGNATTRYQLARLLPEDITREFISRTRYKIVAEPEKADAVLNGALINFALVPVVLDPVSGRATGVQVIVTMQITLSERASGKILFQRMGYEIRERYQISVDPQTYFDETGTAIPRVSKDAARSIVTGILENF